jgi:hypothetical protein
VRHFQPEEPVVIRVKQPLCARLITGVTALLFEEKHAHTSHINLFHRILKTFPVVGNITQVFNQVWEMPPEDYQQLAGEDFSLKVIQLLLQQCRIALFLTGSSLFGRTSYISYKKTGKIANFSR